MGSGFVLSALGSTGAWGSISGNSMHHQMNPVEVIESGIYVIIGSSPLPAVLCALSLWTSGKILSLKR